MKPNWIKAKQLFNDSLKFSPDERPAFFDEVCGDDVELRREVESLLAAYEDLESFMETPAVAKNVSNSIAETNYFCAGKIFGNYEIVRGIAEGGMGSVYLATDKKLDRPVAIKILKDGLANDQSNLMRFMQEAKSASALNHPNILIIHEIGETEGHHYLVSEFIEGDTLRAYCGKSAVDFASVLNISIQIVNALIAAHTAHIIHRDIKPENIIVRPDGFVKILDFGLAKLSEQSIALGPEESTIKAQTAKGMILGTVNYMSPEQAKGERVDERTDIFSLGVTIYEMVTGRTPFVGKSNSETLANLINKEPQMLSRFVESVPAELQRIVAKMLRKEKDLRYQTMKGLSTDLTDLLESISFEEKLERSKSLDHHISASTRSLEAETGRRNFITKKMPSFSRPLFGAILLIALLIGGISLGFWYFGNSSADRGAIASIAVLPFINESGNPENEYLSDGLSESLINSLSGLPHLKVIARNSVFSYKGKDIDAQTIGRELNVEALVTGRVVQRGDDLTISVELTNIRDKSHIWGKQYYRKISDLLYLQRDISSDITENLRPRLTSDERPRATKNYTENVEAYQLYLKGRFYSDQYTEEGFRNAVERFNDAIEKDPNYALAYAGLAEAYWQASVQTLPPREAMPKAREAALKALSLDDTLAEAHTLLASVLAFYDYDFPAAEREFKRAIELNPGSAVVHQWYGWYLASFKRADEALIEIRRAQELDPLSLFINAELGLPFYLTRRYDQAIVQYKRAFEMDPNSILARIGLANSYIKKGMYEEAISVSSEPETDDSFLLGTKAHALARLGNRMEAQKIIEQLNSQQRYQPSYVFTIIHIGLGDKEQAIEWLERAYENREDGMVWLNSDPILDDIRTDPRFRELVRKVGLPE